MVSPGLCEIYIKIYLRQPLCGILHIAVCKSAKPWAIESCRFRPSVSAALALLYGNPQSLNG
jgi:hypothetical protein